MTAIVIIAFGIFAILGMPVAFALGFASIAGLITSSIELVVLPQRMMHAIDSFPLMAIPLFIVAGELMVAAGIMHRLIDFSNAVVGRLHGGLANVTILSGAILASVSGAAVASASALGSILVPSLRKYYDDGYIASVIASAANIGPIIPPSSAMIVYALMAGSSVSVGALFIAGIVPGIILTLALMLVSSIVSYRKKFPLTGQPFSIMNVFRELKRSLIIFMMPILVIGGIVGGVFTATEGAGIAVFYALCIGFFYTRQLKISDLPRVFFRAAIGSSVVAALIAFASTATFIFTVDLLPLAISNFLLGFTKDPTVFLLMVMGILLVVGMFMESNAAYIMLVPLLAPIAATYGIDPLYFGFLFVLNLVIGMMTPPVGVLLFMMCSITNISMTKMIVNVWPFVVVQYVVLILCFLFPDIPLALPRAMGF